MFSKDLAKIIRFYTLFYMQITHTRAFCPYESRYGYIWNEKKTNAGISIEMPLTFNNKCVDMTLFFYHENITSTCLHWHIGALSVDWTLSCLKIDPMPSDKKGNLFWGKEITIYVEDD